MLNGSVAQWIEQLPSKQSVAGSIPAALTITLIKKGQQWVKVKLVRIT